MDAEEAARTNRIEEDSSPKSWSRGAREGDRLIVVACYLQRPPWRCLPPTAPSPRRRRPLPTLSSLARPAASNVLLAAARRSPHPPHDAAAHCLHSPSRHGSPLPVVPSLRHHSPSPRRRLPRPSSTPQPTTVLTAHDAAEMREKEQDENGRAREDEGKRRQQVLDELDKSAKPKWVRTKVNLDDHIIVPDLGPTDTSADPEKAVEDYVSSLSTASMPMDHSRPLWELHVLGFPTAEAAATVVLRMHHSLGDGVSLLSLLIACTRRADDPAALPALPSSAGRRRAGPVHALPPRPPLAAGALALAAWALSYLALAWHTVVDVVCFTLTAASLMGDARTVLKGEEGAEFRPRRFVNRTLSLDDVKNVKNALGCTVNDVLVGLSSAALSRYYFRRTGGSEGKNKVRTALMVNLRPTPGLHELAKMMESSKNNGVKWGNQFGYMILPFHLAKHDDPLEYVRKATEVTRRKKSSMEAIFTYWSADMVVKIFGIKAAASLCYGMFSNTTLSFSNLAGPSEQIVFCGNPIVYISPTSYGHPHALTMHWQSYMNIIKLALAVDETQFPDAHELLDDFTESMRLIREAASRGTEKAHDGP